MVGSTSPTPTHCRHLSIQVSVLLLQLPHLSMISDSFVLFSSRCVYCQLHMQIINVSLAKAYENVNSLTNSKSPYKTILLTFQSKQNSLIFHKVGTLTIAREYYLFHLQRSLTKRNEHSQLQVTDHLPRTLIWSVICSRTNLNTINVPSKLNRPNQQVSEWAVS